MRRVIAITGMLTVLIAAAEAQEPADFGRINQETYRLYQAQQWDSLIRMGRKALKQDVDYFYLRMRLGIAQYEKKNYRAAATHFQRAVEQNQGDRVAMEYLYYARLFAGQSRQAGLVRNRFSGELALKLPKEKGRFFGRAGIEYLYSGSDFGNPASPPEGFYTLPAGIQPVPLTFSNVTVSLENTLSPGSSLSHAYTYLSKSNHYYMSDGAGIYYDLEEQQVSQHQYYLSPGFTTLGGLSFHPMIHFVSVSYQTIVSSGQGYMGGMGSTLGNITDLDLAGGLSVVKEWGPVDLSLGAWYAGLNRAHQLQGRVGLMYYPLGNLNLYVGGALNGQREWTPGAGVYRWVPDMKIGVAIAQKVWVEAGAALGEMHNYMELNGYIIYNGYAEVTDKKANLALLIPLTRKGSLLYLGGRWTAGRSVFVPESTLLPGNDNTIEYQTISIYGGITWKF